MGYFLASGTGRVKICAVARIILHPSFLRIPVFLGCDFAAKRFRAPRSLAAQSDGSAIPPRLGEERIQSRRRCRRTDKALIRIDGWWRRRFPRWDESWRQQARSQKRGSSTRDVARFHGGECAKTPCQARTERRIRTERLLSPD